jgi:hypothetical protein
VRNDGNDAAIVTVSSPTTRWKESSMYIGLGGILILILILWLLGVI